MKIELLSHLKKIKKEFAEIIEIANSTITLQNRLEKTGALDSEIARDHGIVGVAARALGIEVDARIDYPYAAYNQIEFKMATEKEGDVNARFKIRIQEVNSSIGILMESLDKLTESGEIQSKEILSLNKNAIAIGIAEGWRGDIIYLIATDSQGDITRVDVRDPSFLNWTVLGYAGKGNVVPDFPLINKSFNLSYSGNDL